MTERLAVYLFEVRNYRLFGNIYVFIGYLDYKLGHWLVLCCWLRVFIKAVKKSKAFFFCILRTRHKPSFVAHAIGTSPWLLLEAWRLRQNAHLLSPLTDKAKTSSSYARYDLVYGCTNPEKVNYNKEVHGFNKYYESWDFCAAPMYACSLHMRDQHMHLHCTDICRPGWMTAVVIRLQSEINSVLKPPFSPKPFLYSCTSTTNVDPFSTYSATS